MFEYPTANKDFPISKGGLASAPVFAFGSQIHIAKHIFTCSVGYSLLAVGYWVAGKARVSLLIDYLDSLDYQDFNQKPYIFVVFRLFFRLFYRFSR